MTDRSFLDQQIAYYRARANEYDQWWRRDGRYDRGDEHRTRWTQEVAKLQTAVLPLIQDASVLELACGTGIWTKLLAQSARHVVALDASPEVIAINRERTTPAPVEYQLVDLFDWTPTSTFDVVFFSFWLSHVPQDRFDAFWTKVRSALKPDGRALFIDSMLETDSVAQGHEPPDRSGISHRKLNDGRSFDIVKVFYEPAELEQRLTGLGWQGWVRSTGMYFFYGCMHPAEA